MLNSKFSILHSKFNKVAVVTGGLRRLGRQISYFLAAEGYSLALIYNSTPAKEIKRTKDRLGELKARFRLYRCDLSDLKKLKLTAGKIGKDFGKVDLLINNAGIINKVDFRKITPELLDKTLAVNLKAPLFLTQYCIQYLRKSNDPAVINITSLGGLQNWTSYMPYSLSKAAANRLTMLLARKLAPNVRVNAVAPGTIVIKGEEHGTPQKIKKERIPLKRYGTPEDVIAAIKLIIENRYLTGQIIAVDGGRLLN